MQGFLPCILQAIRIAARDELGVKPRTRGARYFATSTLVTTALPQAPLVAAHRHIAGAALPEVNQMLRQFASQEVKQQLYQAAIGSAHTDATSATAKLIGEMIVRPSDSSGVWRTPCGVHSRIGTTRPLPPPISRLPLKTRLHPLQTRVSNRQVSTNPQPQPLSETHHHLPTQSNPTYQSSYHP